MRTTLPERAANSETWGRFAGPLLSSPAAEFCDELVLFDTAAGQAALRDIVAELEAEAASAVDVEDLAHYRGLLGAEVAVLPRRRDAVRFPVERFRSNWNGQPLRADRGWAA